MLKVNVKPISKTNHLCQNYFSGWECAMAHRVKAGEYEQSMVWVFCKDYLNDVIWGHLNQKRAEIYGLTYNPETDPPVDMDRLRVMIRNNNEPKEFPLHCENAVVLIRGFEKKMHFKPTKVREVIGIYCKSPVYLLESDARWMHALPLLSFYGCLARMGKHYDGKKDIVEFVKSRTSNAHSPDDRWLKPVVSCAAFEHLIANTTKCFSSDMKKNYSISSIGNVHNHGIYWYGNAFQRLQDKTIKLTGYDEYCREWDWARENKSEAKAPA